MVKGKAVVSGAAVVVIDPDVVARLKVGTTWKNISKSHGNSSILQPVLLFSLQAKYTLNVESALVPAKSR